jgi:hypothetical protein
MISHDVNNKQFLVQEVKALCMLAMGTLNWNFEDLKAAPET